MTHHAGRWGPSGQVINELESVLTAVVTSADEFAEGELIAGWRLQQELGALESALAQAIALVHRLSSLASETPPARLRREDFALGLAPVALAAGSGTRATAVFAGVAGDLHLDA